MFGLPASAFYPAISSPFMYFPTHELTSSHFLTSTPDGKRKAMDRCSASTKKFSHTNAIDRPVRKCSFDIESLLEMKTKTHPLPDQSYNEDTEDGSTSDEGQTSFRSPPLSSFTLFNQLKTLDTTAHSTNNKSDLTPSSSSESDHSPYRLTSTKHLVDAHHGANAKTKPKRIRTIFTPEQLERLELEFDKQQYMVGNERFYLATTLDLTEAQVKVWFQNRRIKWRRQALDDHQQRLTSVVGNFAGTSTPVAPPGTGLGEDQLDSDSDD